MFPQAPQLWQAELVNKPTKSATPHPEKIARLRLRHTFIPKITVDFTGPSYFGGKDDEMIVCAGKSKSYLTLLKQPIDERVCKHFHSYLIHSW